jgi:hypothetical protein
MLGARRLVFALLVALPLGVLVRTARAEAPNPHATPVYVLSLSTDDADDQADALTHALQSLVREAEGWSLLESPQGFQTLALALKCPTTPDADCLQRIADQLHADHYVWGRVAHKKGAPEVSAEIHLWTRAKGDVEVTTSFGDKVKDASDPALRKVASRAFGKLTTMRAGGALIVHAGSGGGSVLVDGMVKGNLHSGVARIEVADGPHTIAVRVSGFDARDQDATVAPGSEQDVSFALQPTEPRSRNADVSVGQPFPVRRVLGWTAVIVGAGLLAGAAVETVQWVRDRDQSNQDRSQFGPGTDACNPPTATPYTVDACRLSKDAANISAAAWGMGIGGAVVGGIGIILLVSEHGSSEQRRDASASQPRFELLPTVGRQGGALDVRVTF